MAVTSRRIAIVATFCLISSCFPPTYQHENGNQDGGNPKHKGQVSKTEKSTESTELKNEYKSSSGEDHKLSVGDATTRRIGEFTQSTMDEIKRLDGVVLKKEVDLVTASFPLLNKWISPAKALMEFNVCDANLSKKLDEFMKAEYEYIRRCKKMCESRDKFHSTVESAIKFLDDIVMGVVKEVSICEQLKGDEAEDCFLDTYKLAEHKKYFFKSSELVRLKHEADEAMDKMENHWMGCIVRAMSAVKKVNNVLEKKLRCCQRGLYNRGDCVDLDQTFTLTVRIRPEVDDLEMYYIEIKQQDL